MIEETDVITLYSGERRHVETLRTEKNPFQSPHDDAPLKSRNRKSSLVGDSVPLFLTFSTDECDGDSYKSSTDDDGHDKCNFGLGFFSHLINRKRKRNQMAYNIASERFLKDKQHQSLTNQLANIWKGDLGLAVFAPLNVEIDLSTDSTSNSQTTTSSLQHENNRDAQDEQVLFSYSSEDDVHFITVGDDVQACPPILSYAQMLDIHERGLPPPCRIMNWIRAYSLRRDGDYFFTMFNKCNSFKHTLIVIKTTDGDILGGYADTLWGGSNKDWTYTKSNTFFGGGKTFLFASNPNVDRRDHHTSCKTEKDSQSLHIYHWTGENEYCQICDLERGSLGMGGGGSFGFFIEKDFTIGSSGSCSTFHNPPLTQGDDGNFHILDVEVYGFRSFASKVTDCPSSSGIASLSSMMSMNSLT